MDLIYNKKDLKGKVIEEVKFVEGFNCGYIVIKFDNDELCVIRNIMEYETVYSEFCLKKSIIDKADQAEIGIISYEDYRAIVDKREREYFDLKKAEELKLLEELKLKYE